MLPLSNAPLVSIKTLQRVMLDIMVFLVMHFVKRVLPTSLQILEQVLEQHRVIIVLLESIHRIRQLYHVRTVPPLSTPPLSSAPLVPIKQL